MMHNPINRRHRGHRIFEDAFPLTEDEIGRNDHGFAFVALREKREEDFHLIAVVLNIANVVENDASEFVQFCQLLG